MNTPTHFLLVHGSWHGPWCWEALQTRLEQRGHRVALVDLPSVGTDASALGDFDADTEAVSAAAAPLSDPAIVVGHSYGGAVISNAEFPEAVRRLVFLGAFMPDAGRAFTSYLPPGPLPPYVGLRNDGSSAVPEGQALPAFYEDCPDDLVDWAVTRLRPQSQAILSGVNERASWRSIPSTYVVLTEDRAIPPDLQAAFAAQATETVEFRSSHSPFLSKPEPLADLLDSVAASVATVFN